MNTPAKRALYDNLGKNEALALQVDHAVHAASQEIGAATLSKSKI